MLAPSTNVLFSLPVFLLELEFRCCHSSSNLVVGVCTHSSEYIHCTVFKSRFQYKVMGKLNMKYLKPNIQQLVIANSNIIYLHLYAFPLQNPCVICCWSRGLCKTKMIMTIPTKTLLHCQMYKLSTKYVFRPSGRQIWPGEEFTGPKLFRSLQVDVIVELSYLSFKTCVGI